MSSELHAAILAYVRNFSQQEGQDEESFEVAVQCLEAGFGIGDLSDEQRKATEVEFSLEDIFEVGLQTLRVAKKKSHSHSEHASHLHEYAEASQHKPKDLRAERADIEREVLKGHPGLDKDPRFAQFMDKLRDHPMFKGVESAAEYRKRYEVAVGKFLEKFANSEPALSATVPRVDVSEKVLSLLEEAKAKDHPKSSEPLLAEAFALGPSQELQDKLHRERGFLRLGWDNPAGAAEDLTEYVKNNGEDLKAIMKLGGALKLTEQYEEAYHVYEKVLEVDPANRVVIEKMDECATLAKSQRKSRPQKPVVQEEDVEDADDDGPNPYGMPFGGGAGGAPNLGDFASLLNNPEIMGMAQQMMQNPMFMNMAQGMMRGQGQGSAGAPPDLNDLLNNPDIQNMMQDPQVQQVAANLRNNPEMMDQLGRMGGMGGLPDLGGAQPPRRPRHDDVD